MAGSVNKVILCGNLGRDPEIRRTAAGDPVASFRIATSETWKDKVSGERKERTEWHSIVVFNENIARVAEQYLRKGSKVYIEGALQTRKYTDNAGVEKYTTEVVLQRFRGEMVLLTPTERPAPDADSYGTVSTRESGSPRSGSQSRGEAGGAGGARGGVDLDDDIPF